MRLTKAEHLNWIQSSKEWVDIGRLRDQMVQETNESVQVFVDTLNQAHRFLPAMANTVECLQAQLTEHFAVAESQAAKHS